MVSFPAVMRLRPEFREFMRPANLVHRGEILAFRANVRTPYFTTDGSGFRRSHFAGAVRSLDNVMAHRRYGVVLGSSHIFGLGMTGDENTLTSLLGNHFGFPFANLSLPEGNSRNLYALLADLVARMRRRPAVLVHFSGGDFTSFSYSSLADQVFGAPNLKQVPVVMEELGGRPAAEASVRRLLAFTTLWTSIIATVCRGWKIPVVLGNDITFFEKQQPNEVERESKLGIPTNPTQEVWFANHKQLFPTFLAHREQVAQRLGAPLAGPSHSNQLSFIDEFHYDREGTRRLFEDVAEAVTPLLR